MTAMPQTWHRGGPHAAGVGGHSAKSSGRGIAGLGAGILITPEFQLDYAGTALHPAFT